MKSEHDLNGHLAKLFKTLEPRLKYVKFSDKYHIGISDFILWGGGTSVAMEVKWVKELPKRDGSKVLSHIFGGAQRSFLHQMDMTRNGGFGLVGVEEFRKVYVMKHNLIPKSGNWIKSEFVHQFVNNPEVQYDYNDIGGLLTQLFEYEERVLWPILNC